MYPEDPPEQGRESTTKSARIRLKSRPNNVKQVKSALLPAQYENISCKNFRSIKLSGKLLTYPSPKKTLPLTYYLGQNVRLRER